MDPLLDPYSVLEVPRDASPEDVRRAFRDKASRLHPDRNPGNAEAERLFKEANSAFQLLSDPARRAKWDRDHPVPGPGPADQAFGGYGQVADSFKQAMEDLFRDGTARQRATAGPADPAQTPVAGEDIQAVLHVTLREAASGCVKVVEAKLPGHRVPCSSCEATGNRPGGRKFPCGSCSGRGTKVAYGAGVGPSLGACPSCKGTGRTSPDKCAPCRGTGKVAFHRRAQVTVPAGIADGQVLRLAGLGFPGVMSRPGDLFVTVRVGADDFFRREGKDIRVMRVLTLEEALEAGEVDVPTVDGGAARVKVPEGVGPGKEARVEGAGIQSALDPGRKGDLVVEFCVAMPEVVSPRARKLAEELVEELRRKPQP